MLAPFSLPPQARPPREFGATEAAREATKRRKAYHSKRSYRGVVRICLIAGVIVTAVVGYLWLMTRAAALDNRLTKAAATEASLQEAQIALQDRLATLESRDRLFALANRVGMREPQAYLIVRAPGPVQVSEHAPILSALVSWLHPR
jgi:hypothetical protein